MVDGLNRDSIQDSAFFRREQQRDAETQAKAQQLLQRRDELLATLNWKTVERDVEQPVWTTFVNVELFSLIFLFQIAALEATRDLDHTIIHIDMDAFYAAVEIRDNPKWVKLVCSFRLYSSASVSP
jgi:DNA polymerase kappa